MRVRTLLLIVLFLIVAGQAFGQLSVGDPFGTPDGTAGINLDTITTAAGKFQITGSGNGALEVDVACNASATFYLYDLDGSDDVRRVYGPFYTRSWAAVRAPITDGRVDAVHVTANATAAELIVTPRSE
jgi:hypothetical protein